MRSLGKRDWKIVSVLADVALYRCPHDRQFHGPPPAVQTEDSITTIGIESGFGSSQYFSRVFKKYLGVTPTDYRRLFGARPMQ